MAQFRCVINVAGRIQVELVTADNVDLADAIGEASAKSYGGSLVNTMPYDADLVTAIQKIALVSTLTPAESIALNLALGGPLPI